MAGLDVESVSGAGVEAPRPVRAVLDELAAIVRAGRGGPSPVAELYGATGASVALVAAELARVAGPVVLLTENEPRAEALARDVGFFLRDEAKVVHVPAPETSPYADLSPDRRAIARRLAALFRLTEI